MAAYRRLDQRCDDLSAGELREGVVNWACHAGPRRLTGSDWSDALRGENIFRHK